MSHKASVKTLDRTMWDLHNSNCPMGGCTVLFSADFVQILPVITRGTRADEVNASLKRLYLWPHMSKCELKRTRELYHLAKIIIGNFLLTCSKQVMVNNTLNNLCALMKNIEELTEKVYPDISNISTKTVKGFQERAILSPTNEQIDKINDFIFFKIWSFITNILLSWHSRG